MNLSSITGRRRLAVTVAVSLGIAAMLAAAGQAGAPLATDHSFGQNGNGQATAAPAATTFITDHSFGQNGNGQTTAAPAPTTFISEHSFGQNGNGRSAAGVAVARPAVIDDSGFDWRDAGIGAAVALGLALLALATMRTVRRRHTIAHIPS